MPLHFMGIRYKNMTYTDLDDRPGTIKPHGHRRTVTARLNRLGCRPTSVVPYRGCQPSSTWLKYLPGSCFGHLNLFL